MKADEYKYDIGNAAQRYADGEPVAKLAKELGMCRAQLYRRLRKDAAPLPVSTTERQLRYLIRDELANTGLTFLKPERLAASDAMLKRLVDENKFLRERLAIAENSARLNFDTISGMNKARREDRP